MAAQGGGADDGAGRQRVQIGMAVADEGISGVFAFEYRRQFEAGIQLHRHILQRMHRDVGLTAFQRQFQLLQEQTLAADGRQRAIQYLVAARRQRHQFHHQIRVQRAQTRGHMFGLPQGELTLAGGDTQQHARVPAGIRARSREQNGLGGKFRGLELPRRRLDSRAMLASRQGWSRGRTRRTRRKSSKDAKFGRLWEVSFRAIQLGWIRTRAMIHAQPAFVGPDLSGHTKARSGAQVGRVRAPGCLGKHAMPASARRPAGLAAAADANDS